MRARRALAVATSVVAGVVAAREVASIARLRGTADPGGRADHAATVGEGIGQPLRLLLLGDSAVDGFGLTVAASLPRQVAARLSVATGRRVDVRSVAVSGARTADVLQFQLPLARAAGRVDALVVGVGVNDALGRTDGGSLERDTAALADGLHRVAPGAATAFVACHDLSLAPGLGPVLRRVVGRRCRAVASRQRRVVTAAGIPVVPFDGPGDASLYGEDGLHPGADGVILVARLTVETLLTAATSRPS